MTTSLRARRVVAALFTVTTATALLAGTALAHPGTEADHGGSSCIVTVEPGTIATGQEFTVAGTFGGASIFIVPGTEGIIGEDAEPDATTPQGSSFSVTFTALGPGTYTVWGMIVGSECGDSDQLVVTAVLPDTALETPAVPGLEALLAVFGLLLVVPAVAIGLARHTALGSRTER